MDDCLYTTLAKVNEDIQKLQIRNSREEDEIQHLENVLKGLDQENAELKTRNYELSVKEAMAQNEYQMTVVAKANVQKEIDELTKEGTKLESRVKNLENQIKHLQALSIAKKNEWTENIKRYEERMLQSPAGKEKREVTSQLNELTAKLNEKTMEYEKLKKEYDEITQRNKDNWDTFVGLCVKTAQSKDEAMKLAKYVKERSQALEKAKLDSLCKPTPVLSTFLKRPISGARGRLALDQNKTFPSGREALSSIATAPLGRPSFGSTQTKLGGQLLPGSTTPKAGPAFLTVSKSGLAGYTPTKSGSTPTKSGPPGSTPTAKAGLPGPVSTKAALPGSSPAKTGLPGSTSTKNALCGQITPKSVLRGPITPKDGLIEPPATKLAHLTTASVKTKFLPVLPSTPKPGVNTLTRVQTGFGTPIPTKSVLDSLAALKAGLGTPATTKSGITGLENISGQKCDTAATPRNAPTVVEPKKLKFDFVVPEPPPPKVVKPKTAPAKHVAQQYGSAIKVPTKQLEKLVPPQNVPVEKSLPVTTTSIPMDVEVGQIELKSPDRKKQKQQHPLTPFPKTKSPDFKGLFDFDCSSSSKSAESTPSSPFNLNFTSGGTGSKDKDSDGDFFMSSFGMSPFGNLF